MKVHRADVEAGKQPAIAVAHQPVHSEANPATSAASQTTFYTADSSGIITLPIHSEPALNPSHVSLRQFDFF